MNEALCPLDFQSAGIIEDDEINDILVSRSTREKRQNPPQPTMGCALPAGSTAWPRRPPARRDRQLPFGLRL